MRFGVGQVGVQLAQADVVGGARRRFGQPLEVHERVAKRRVRLRRGLARARIGRPQRRVRAGRRCAAGFVDALHIGAPRQVLDFQLAGQRRRRQRVHAAFARQLLLAADRRRSEGRVLRAVGRRRLRRPLAAEQRYAVGQLLVRDGVVARQQRSARLERARQVGSRRRWPEHGRVRLVGQHDHEHVPDRRQLRGRGAGRRRCPRLPPCPPPPVPGAEEGGALAGEGALGWLAVLGAAGDSGVASALAGGGSLAGDVVSGVPLVACVAGTTNFSFGRCEAARLYPTCELATLPSSTPKPANTSTSSDDTRGEGSRSSDSPASSAHAGRARGLAEAPPPGAPGSLGGAAGGEESVRRRARRSSSSSRASLQTTRSPQPKQ